MSRRGQLITFEGGEGGGKSTQILHLARHLETIGVDVITTREPGGTEGAEAIRNLVTEGAADRWLPLTETLLFLAARHDHVSRLIKPALDAGRWVLCDRFVDSTRVYQGVAGTLGLDLIDSLHGTIFADVTPDLTLLLDVPIKVGLARRQGAGDVNRFDRMVSDFHQRVRQGFLDLASAEPGRFAKIDASLDEADVETMIRKIILERFDLHQPDMP